MSDAGFHPNKSKVSSSTMETWKNSNITGDLTQVPGIGKAAAAKLANAEVANTYQLFGMYLMMKGPDEKSMDPSIHNEKFWIWLQDVGIVSHRSAVVVAVAEKLSQLFPDIYDPAAYDDDNNNNNEEEQEES